MPNEFKNKNGNQMDHLNWNNFSACALNNKPTYQPILDKIKDVRKLGNFAAHFGQMQDKGFEQWEQENHDVIKGIVKKILSGQNVDYKNAPPGYKLYTSINDACYAIKESIKFIESVAKMYNTGP